MNIEIANRLVNLRKQSGLSQEQLAEKIGVSRQAVSKWERSEASPDTDNIILLARLYNISLDELLSTEDEIPTGESTGNTEEPEASGFDSAEETAENTAENTGEASSGYGDNYYNYGDGEDKVHIGLDGIHVSSKNGDEVHVGWGGIHVNEHKGDKVDIDHRGIHVNEHGGDNVSVDENGVFVNGEKKDIGKCVKQHVGIVAPVIFVAFVCFICLGAFCNGWGWSWLCLLGIPVLVGIIESIVKRDIGELGAPIVFGCTIVFFYYGFFHDLWGIGWTVFLLIPVLCSVLDVIKKKHIKHFCYPVFVAYVFLLFGLISNLWHPLWIVFLTVPLFYWLVNLIPDRNSRDEDNCCGEYVNCSCDNGQD